MVIRYRLMGILRAFLEKISAQKSVISRSLHRTCNDMKLSKDKERYYLLELRYFFLKPCSKHA